MNMEKFVFLDRAGVVIEDAELLCKKEQVKLIPRADEAIRMLNKEEYRVIFITNQPVIARGLCTLPELEEIHQHIRNLFAKMNAYIDAIYFCPHHPNPKRGLIGKNGPDLNYVMECECRKPKPGMIIRAKKDLKILDLSGCYMIGDSISDIKAGRDAGCKTILVDSKNDEFSDAVPDFRAKDLYDAVRDIILREGSNETVY